MSPGLVDLLIWILLFAGIGFGLLAFVGMLIFPDIRSRRFTASRAVLISLTLVTGAAIVFGFYRYPGGGADYLALVIRAFVLWLLLTITAVLVSRSIMARVSAEQQCGTLEVPHQTGTDK